MKIALVILSFISAIQAVESGKDSKQCPKVAFLPAISEKHGSCDFSNNCNKVKCVMDNGHKFTVTLKINKCDNPLTATVKLQHPDTDLDWSHTLKDEEKAKVPTKSSSFTEGVPVNDAALFIQVGLKKMNGTSVNYTVTLTGHLTVYGETTNVNYVILQGRSNAVANDDCSWFSKQPAYVKVLVIAIPVVMVILVGTVGIVFCCYKRRARDVNARWPMHRLTNEV